MHIGQRIKQLAKLKGYNAIVLSQKLGITDKAVYQLFERDSIKTSQLIKFSEILEIPITMFFSNDQILLESKAEPEVKELKQRCNRYEEIIDTLTASVKSLTKVETVNLKQLFQDRDDKLDKMIKELEEKLLNYLRKDEKD